eukprot:TRINITY_DN21661_c0_g2_i1.p1 TRINITY_DN21661_c0_g2~~TRINITY_DN21661_c0_g2_i1.p1  ORF type:complete len:187 (+),score=55.93 TRINITY_DN21661_c0_g2_i1:83-643(+)
MVKRNKPTEASARKPVSCYRQVFKEEVRESRDPRFSDLSGHFNQGLYEASYSFLDSMKQEEEKKLRRKVSRLGSARSAAAVADREAAASELRQLKQERILKRREDRQRRVKREWRKQEAAAVAKGKKPFFMKRSVQKEQVLKQQFQDMREKGGGQVDKYMAKQRKKQAIRDSQSTPALSSFAPKKS